MPDRTIAVTGVPASGKTTLFRELLAHLGPLRSFKYGLLRGAYAEDHGIYVLGVYDGQYYGGTDRLPMNVAPHARSFLDDPMPGTAIFEGDRLCTPAVLDRAPSLEVYHLVVSPEVLEERYAARATEGRTQAKGWLKGRMTKVRNVSERYGAQALPHDTPDDTHAALGVLLNSLQLAPSNLTP